ncbi:hypothetical protein [Nocardioides ferulae]|uniref:hypothetical protein n=1 Tax=Nocardioides ferulae TaxID=2340821 RepID=UPI000EADFB16|nr:hypothetical protein [Nocardioides ferulae]
MNSNASRYLINLTGFRLAATKEFEETDPAYAARLSATDEYVAHLIYSLSGNTMVENETERYLHYLLVTFVRGHFHVTHFARSGELLEGGVLFRRQMEVLARLHEVRATPDLAALLRKTPNVGRLQTNLNRLYGSYSAIAHGSDTREGDLLGTPFGEDHGDAYPVFPRFTRHAYVLVGHVIFSVLELHFWLLEHADDLGWPIDKEWVEDWWTQNVTELVRLL